MSQGGFAIVGASEKNIPWTEWLIASLGKHDYPGELWLVNPRSPVVHGRDTYPDLDSLPATPEIAAVMTSADVALQQIEQLIGMGCRQIMLVSNGFGELGTDEGRARDVRLRELTASTDVIIVGPNCVGFASMHDGVCAIALPIPHHLVAGDVSVLSQSGGLTTAVIGAVREQSLGLDLAFSLGNGTVFGVVEAIEHAIARPTTRVVLGVVESMSNREGIERAAEAARLSGKTIALLLLGASEASKGVAQSHTGAVVGEQRLTAAWLHSIGIVTAASIDELARIASVSKAVAGEGAGAFVGTASGGGAGLTADLAARHGVPFAQLSPPTVERLRAVLPEGAYVGNPLDINTASAAEVYAALTDEPAVRYLIEPWSLPWPTADDEYHWQRATMGRLADTARTTGLPVLIASIWHQPVSEWMKDFATANGIDVSPDLELTLAALAALSRSAHLPGDLLGRSAAQASGHGTASAVGLVAEAAARAALEEAGLPVVRGQEVADADAAVAVAGTLTAPFAVKLSMDSVGHKERVGGVVLGVRDEHEVREACDRIRANAIAAGVSDGSDVRFLVTEMVGGPEILVGVIRDPISGPAATVSIGGWAAEAGAIFGTIPLPMAEETITERVAGWNLPHLLGERRASDLAGFLTSLSGAVEGPLAAYREIEINPVMLTPRGALVVDALLIGSPAD